MPPIYEQRLLSMTAAQWATLEALAVETNSVATRGPQAGQASWRSMLERIGNHELVVITPVHRAKLRPQLEKV